MAYPAADTYVDPAAGGANNGNSWGDAYTNLQTAYDAAVAGENIYCRGTQDVSGGAITFDGVPDGTAAGGHIRIYGCDAGGTPGDGEFVIDGGDAANGINVTTVLLRLWMEHVKFVDCIIGLDLNQQYSDFWVLKHCIFESCVNYGMFLDRCRNGLVINCIFRDNGSSSGCRVFGDMRIVDCLAEGNTSGFSMYSVNTLWNCLSYENSVDGFTISNTSNTFFNCVGADHGAGSGINLLAQTGNVILGCRLTDNNDNGIETTAASDDANYADYNLFNANVDPTDDETTTQSRGVTNSITNPGGGSGYVDAVADNYEVATGKELRSTANNLDWDV